MNDKKEFQMIFKTIGKTVYKVHDFLSWQRNKSLVLSPSFQRRPVWTKSAKSYLIDTIVKGLPIPIIFLRERTDLKTLEPYREVVDGQQRLRTIISFIDYSLIDNYNHDRDDFTILKSHNKELANKRFNDFDDNIKQRILQYEFSVHTLPSDTEDSEVLQIFARMNSTGVKLNYQELRNAEYFGIFKNTCYQLAYEYLNTWRDWSIFSENEIARMLEVEEASDLISMMLNSKIQSKSQTSLNNIYKKYDDEFPYHEEVIHRFRYVMDKISNTIGRDIVNTEFKRKALFNTLFTFYYEQIFSYIRIGEHAKPNLISPKINAAIRITSDKIRQRKLPEELLKVLRGATNNLESRKQRLNFLNDIFKNL